MSHYNITETSIRLKQCKISFYKISDLVGEPQSTIQNIFKGHNKYSEERIQTILNKINVYLDELERKNIESGIESKIKIPSMEDCPEIFDNHELYTRLFEIGLNSNKFNPEEKLHFAIWHRALREFKKQKNLNKPKEEN